MTQYVVTEDIRHGGYRSTTEHSGASIGEATQAALAASPYNALAAEDASKVAGLALALTERGEGEVGWAHYELRKPI